MKQWYIVVMGGILCSHLYLVQGSEKEEDISKGWKLIFRGSAQGEQVTQKTDKSKQDKRSSLVSNPQRMSQIDAVIKSKDVVPEAPAKKPQEFKTIELGAPSIPQYHEPQNLDPIELAAAEQARRSRCCACLLSCCGGR